MNNHHINTPLQELMEKLSIMRVINFMIEYDIFKF